MKTPLLLISLAIILSTTLTAQGIAAKTEAKIDQVKNQYGLTGDKVLLVMMDRGIDYRHPDFIGPDGQTRIAYIYDPYDPTGANDADNPMGVGTIYNRAEINASLQSGGEYITNDIFGHGTATTGIIAGNGSAASPADKFAGVATEATIISIIVATDYVPPFGSNPGQPGGYNETALPPSFEFAKLKIAELNMPSVTLLNIGSMAAPTDGNTTFCDLVSDYVANGHPFVCGVGDEGGKDNHMIGNLVTNQNTEFIIQKGEQGNLRFIAWYNEQERFNFTIEKPNGEIDGPFLPPTSPTDAKDEFLSDYNIYHRGADAEFYGSNSNIRHLMIDFTSEIGTYKITMTPTVAVTNGTVNAFLNPAFHYNENNFLNNNNPGGNIHSFASCHDGIAPTDYVVSNDWIDINGVARSKNGEGLPGELWLGSSIGPTMDGRIGVDIAAPGEYAAAAYSPDSYYAFFEFNTLAESNGYYGIQNAVSAAAPVLTGVIALMLEVNPNLTPAEIKTILHQSARSDNFTGSTPNNVWGYGKLDALAAINQTYLTVDNSNPFHDLDILLTPNPAHGFIKIIYPDDFPPNINLSLHSSDGRKLKESTCASGDQINVSDLPPGAYFIKGQIEEKVFTEIIFKH